MGHFIILIFCFYIAFVFGVMSQGYFHERKYHCMEKAQHDLFDYRVAIIKMQNLITNNTRSQNNPMKFYIDPSQREDPKEEKK